MCDPIILDDMCLRRGIPPLSMGHTSAISMIHQMNPEQKRKVLRKVRKLAKTEIARRCKLIKNSQKRISLKTSLERQTNLSRSDKQTHRKLFIERRLLLVKQLFESMVTT